MADSAPRNEHPPEDQCPTTREKASGVGLGVGLWQLLTPDNNLAVMDVPSYTSVRIYPYLFLATALLICLTLLARALYSYTAAIPEELGFTKGDVLSVIRLQDRKSTRLNSSHSGESRMPSSA